MLCTLNFIFNQDNTVFGETYASLTEVTDNKGTAPWNTEVKGGKSFQTDTPPDGGWLVVAFFYSMWSDSVSFIPKLVELAPNYQDATRFVSVNATSLDQIKVSKLHSIVKFPTIIIFRNGIEIERIEGADRLIDKLMKLLALHITESDKECHLNHISRIQREQGIEVNTMTETKNNNVNWTWALDGAGPSLNIDRHGFVINT